MAAEKRASVVTLRLEEEQSLTTAESMDVTADANAAAEDAKYQPKHARFAQLLALRQQSRSAVTTRYALDDDDGALRKEASPLGRSVSMSSFAGLPVTTQRLTKVIASIEFAREEAKQDAEVERIEREAALADEHHAHALRPEDDGGDARLSEHDVGRLLAGVRDVALQQQGEKRSMSASTNRANNNVRIEVQGLTHIRQHDVRVMSLIDLALKHKIAVYPKDPSGVEAYVDLVEPGREAPLLPKHRLMVPDDAPVYDLPDVGTATGGGGPKRKKPKSTIASSGAPMDPAAVLARGNRLPIPDMMRSYNEHCLVADKALADLRQETGEAVDAKLLARLEEREGRRFCEPIPGIRTVFYFPNLYGDDNRRAPGAKPDAKRAEHRWIPEDGRMATLQSCARKVNAKGLLFHPVVWECLTAQQPGMLTFGCHRSFHSVFAYQVVVHPKRLYLNLERMCQGLASPLVLRRVLYLCCGRSLAELDVWKALYGQYVDAKKYKHVSSWLRRYTKMSSDPSSSSTSPSLAETTRRRSGHHGLFAAEAEATHSSTMSSGTGEGPVMRPVVLGSSDPTLCAAFDDVYCQLSDVESEPLPSATEVDPWAYPFGVVDCALQTLIDHHWYHHHDGDARPDRFSDWFVKAEVPVAVVARRFHDIVTRNTSDDQLLQAYLTLLPVDATLSRRGFDNAQTSGVLPPSDVWVPPNTTTEVLESIENSVSAKAASDRDAKMMMRFLGGFRTDFHPALSLWIGEVVSADYAFSGSKRNGAPSVAPPTKAQVETPILRWSEPPGTLLSAVAEEMHPEWPKVEGWERPDFGGIVPRAGDVPAGKVKKAKTPKDPFDSNPYAKSKTVVMAEAPTLESRGRPFVPTPCEPPPSSSTAADGEDDEDEDDSLHPPRAASPSTDTTVRPHDRYADVDALTLYHGQGLYYEAFAKLMTASPVFAKHSIGLVLRFATHFGPVD